MTKKALLHDDISGGGVTVADVLDLTVQELSTVTGSIEQAAATLAQWLLNKYNVTVYVVAEGEDGVPLGGAN